MTAVKRPAKFTLPRQRGIVLRERLFARLDAARDTPAIWIAGVPGAGKTTLAASYVQARQVRCVWFRVDAADNDPAEFFQSMSQAAGVQSANRRPLPGFAAEHAPKVQDFARRYFRALYSRLAVPCCVVLDNLHHLEAGLPLDMVRIALEEAPADVQFLILSRGGPSAEFTALESERRLERLDNDALRFTLDELQALLPTYPAAELASMHELTQGWTAGIVLAVGYDVGRRAHRDDAGSESREAIFRFFSHEVLRAMPANEQRFLQLAALLPDMSVTQAQALTGEADAARILDGLYRRGLFTTYRRGTPSTYQFHDLMRAFLRREAQAQIAAAELAGAKQHAAQLLHEAGDIPSALDLLITAREWDSARRMLTDSAPKLLRQGRYTTLRRWIESLPESALDADPWLLYWLAQAVMREDELAACAWFERAYQAFAQRGETRGQILSCASAIAAIHVAEADYKTLGTWSERLRLLVTRLSGPVEPNDQIHLAVALIAAANRGAPVLATTETLATVEHLLAAIEAEPGAFDDEAIVCAGIAVFSFCFRQRNLPLFERCQRLIEPFISRPFVGPLARGRWLIGKCSAIRYLQPNSASGAAAAAAAWREARVIAEREQLAPLLCATLMAETVLAFVRHDNARISELVPKVGESMQFGRPVFAMTYFTFLCRMHLTQGNLAAALQAAENAQRIATQSSCPASERLALTIIHCNSLIASQREDEAVALLEPMIRDLKDRQRTVAVTLGVVARTWQNRRRGEEFVRTLRKAMQMAAQCACTLLLEARPSIAGELFGDALEHDIEPEFVRACIARQQLMAPMGAGEQWPRPIKLRLLGPFELRVRDAPVEFGAKTPRRLVELLQAIATSGPSGLDARRALDWLWPDGDVGRKSLDIAVFRLRRSLGGGSAILVQEGRLLLDHSRVWSDLRQFEVLSARLLEADLTRYSVGQLDAQARSLLKLCRGPLLPDEPAHAWLVRARKRYHSRFERVVQTLGRHMEERAQWPAALDLYERAVEHDNLAEEMYRGQIRCHLTMGQQAAALCVYRRCRELLSIVLGVAPAPQTEVLVAALREKR